MPVFPAVAAHGADEVNAVQYAPDPVPGQGRIDRDKEIAAVDTCQHTQESGDIAFSDHTDRPARHIARHGGDPHPVGGRLHSEPAEADPVLPADKGSLVRHGPGCLFQIFQDISHSILSRILHVRTGHR